MGWAGEGKVEPGATPHAHPAAQRRAHRALEEEMLLLLQLHDARLDRVLNNEPRDLHGAVLAEAVDAVLATAGVRTGSHGRHGPHKRTAACDSAAGFHHGSIRYTRDAAVRLSATPPALSEMRNTLMCGCALAGERRPVTAQSEKGKDAAATWLVNASITVARCAGVMRPSSLTHRTPVAFEKRIGEWRRRPVAPAPARPPGSAGTVALQAPLDQVEELRKLREDDAFCAGVLGALAGQLLHQRVNLHGPRP